MNIRIDQLKKEITVLQEKKQELRAQLNQSSQEEYLDKEAREKFNLKKPGEEVATVLPAEKEKVENSGGQSFWEKILEKLKF